MSKKNTKLNKMERKISETTIGQCLEIDTDYYSGAKAFSIDELQNFLNKAKEKALYEELKLKYSD